MTYCCFIKASNSKGIVFKKVIQLVNRVATNLKREASGNHTAPTKDTDLVKALII